MKYTEQELNALFDAVMVGASDLERNTPHFRDEIKFSVKLILDGRVGRRVSPAPYTLDLPAALRLMREASEQGAAGMRERAAAQIPTWSRQIGTDSDVLRDRILALPLAITRDC